jgi:hypothetical protein
MAAAEGSSGLLELRRLGVCRNNLVLFLILREADAPGDRVDRAVEAPQGTAILFDLVKVPGRAPATHATRSKHARR